MAVRHRSEKNKVNEPGHEVRHILPQQRNGLSCIYEISNLNENVLSIPELLKQAAEILSKGTWFSDMTGAAIEYDGHIYQSTDSSNPTGNLSVCERVSNTQSLTVEFAYPEGRFPDNERSIPDEERQLIGCVANLLSSKIRQILSGKKIKEKQQLLDKAYQLAHIGSWEFDMKTHELYWSPVTKEVHGFNQDYEPDLESTINLFKQGRHRETFRQAAMNAIEHEKPFDVELKIISGRGDERWIRATGEPEYEDGECIRFYGISQDVTCRRQAEEDLQRSEQRFKSLVQDGSDLIAILDPEGNYKYVSPSVKSILGIPAEDYIGTNALDYIHKDDIDRISGILSELAPGERIDIPPFRFIDADDDWRWIETTLTNMTEDPAVDGMVANSRDVTKQIQQQQQSLESLKEKEILLAEIHHRVKNNLAVVSGMMQLQALEEENKEIKDRLFDSISRIKTMANIHEQLYKSNSFSKLEFSDNLRSLVLSIQKTFQTDTQIDVNFDCQPVSININQAIPCSLIVNEVVTNVFKHAFPERKKGNIRIALNTNSKNDIQLSISDDGIGLPGDINAIGGGSLGVSLIDVLSQQLNADYTYNSNGSGTVFTIQFGLDEIKGIGNGYLK